jgi:ketopantoate hydroxymethyltransferase
MGVILLVASTGPDKFLVGDLPRESCEGSGKTEVKKAMAFGKSDDAVKWEGLEKFSGSPRSRSVGSPSSGASN